MFNNFGIYLTKIMKDTKTTNKVLAEWITDNHRKIGQNAIAKYRDGSRTPPPDFISIVSEYFKINEQFFFDGNGALKISSIPLIGLASCGVPNTFYNDDIQHIPVSDDIAREGVYAVTAEGDSMLTKISHGDIIICDKEMPCENGNIVHYTTIDGESGIKKYSCNPETKQVTLKPLNSDYEPIIKHHEDIKCARCFKIMSDL